MKVLCSIRKKTQKLVTVWTHLEQIGCSWEPLQGLELSGGFILRLMLAPGSNGLQRLEGTHSTNSLQGLATHCQGVSVDYSFLPQKGLIAQDIR